MKEYQRKYHVTQKGCLLIVFCGKTIYITLLEDGALRIQEEDGHKIPLVSERLVTQVLNCHKEEERKQHTKHACVKKFMYNFIFHIDVSINSASRAPYNPLDRPGSAVVLLDPARTCVRLEPETCALQFKSEDETVCIVPLLTVVVTVAQWGCLIPPLIISGFLFPFASIRLSVTNRCSHNNSRDIDNFTCLVSAGLKQ